MEKVGIRDFIDVVYAYSINSPQMRNEFRSSMSSYIFDYKEAAPEAAEDMSFDGFQSQALSLLDDLDEFTS